MIARVEDFGARGLSTAGLLTAIVIATTLSACSSAVSPVASATPSTTRSTAAYQAPGDTKDDGIGGVWHLAKP